MIKNMKPWRKKLNEFHPQKLILLKSGEYLYDFLIDEGLIAEKN